jgi:hypothetical protein
MKQYHRVIAGCWMSCYLEESQLDKNPLLKSPQGISSMSHTCQMRFEALISSLPLDLSANIVEVIMLAYLAYDKQMDGVGTNLHRRQAISIRELARSDVLIDQELNELMFPIRYVRTSSSLCFLTSRIIAIPHDGTIFIEWCILYKMKYLPELDPGQLVIAMHTSHFCSEMWIPECISSRLIADPDALVMLDPDFCASLSPKLVDPNVACQRIAKHWNIYMRVGYWNVKEVHLGTVSVVLAQISFQDAISWQIAMESRKMPFRIEDDGKRSIFWIPEIEYDAIRDKIDEQRDQRRALMAARMALQDALHLFNVESLEELVGPDLAQLNEFRPGKRK